MFFTGYIFKCATVYIKAKKSREKNSTHLNIIKSTLLEYIFYQTTYCRSIGFSCPPLLRKYKFTPENPKHSRSVGGIRNYQKIKKKDADYAFI